MCLSKPGVRTMALPDGARKEAMSAAATMGGGTPRNSPRTPGAVKSSVLTAFDTSSPKGDTRFAGGMKL